MTFPAIATWEQIMQCFIAHDMSVVRNGFGRVAIIFPSKIVEPLPATVVLDRPSYPYTQSLESAIPVPDPKFEKTRKRLVLAGSPLSTLPRDGPSIRGIPVRSNAASRPSPRNAPEAACVRLAELPCA